MRAKDPSRVCEGSYGLPAIPLNLKVGVERDRVVDDLVEQVAALAPILAKSVPSQT